MVPCRDFYYHACICGLFLAALTDVSLFPPSWCRQNIDVGCAKDSALRTAGWMADASRSDRGLMYDVTYLGTPTAPKPNTSSLEATGIKIVTPTKQTQLFKLGKRKLQV